MPTQSYIISCTPRCGSHLLAGALTSTGIAGIPGEKFPKFTTENGPKTAAERDRLVTQPPPESSYDPKLDAEYVAEVLRKGATPNGVFGITIHWFQLNDAVRRILSYLGRNNISQHETLSSAFPHLSYIWLRRRDKVAQAISWYKAIETGQYVKLRSPGENRAPEKPLEFDYSKIRAYFSALRSADNGWDHFFSSNGVKPFVIYYEDLCADYDRSALAVLEYLKLDYNHVSVGITQYEKAGNQQSIEWAEKFKLLQAEAKKRSAGR